MLRITLAFRLPLGASHKSSQVTWTEKFATFSFSQQWVRAEEWIRKWTRCWQIWTTRTRYQGDASIDKTSRKSNNQLHGIKMRRGDKARALLINGWLNAHEYDLERNLLSSEDLIILSHSFPKQKSYCYSNNDINLLGASPRRLHVYKHSRQNSDRIHLSRDTIVDNAAGSKAHKRRSF